MPQGKLLGADLHRCLLQLELLEPYELGATGLQGQLHLPLSCLQRLRRLFKWLENSACTLPAPVSLCKS